MASTSYGGRSKDITVLQALPDRSGVTATPHPVTDFIDLDEFAQLVADAHIVGLGECTHGVREFTQLRYRVVQFLVLELDFRAVVLEAGYAACTTVNRWLRDGTGSRASVVAALGSPAWVCDEFAAMLDWLRAYNSRVEAADQVQIFGLDNGGNAVGREAIWHHLAAESPTLLDDVAPALRALEDWERLGPWGIGVVPTADMPDIEDGLDLLVDYFAPDPDDPAVTVDPDLWVQLRHYVAALREWVDGAGVTSSARLGEHLIDLIETVDVDGRYVVLAHNTHLGMAMPDEPPTMGDRLRDRFDRAYCPIALEFRSGSVRGLPRGYDAAHPVTTTFTVPAATPGSLAELLGPIEEDALLVDLTDAEAIAALGTPASMRSRRWLTEGEVDVFVEIDPAEHWDGLILFDAVTPTTLPDPGRPLSELDPALEPVALDG